ncbi:MAG: hypothetical protein GX488_00755 [Clostridiales bacterium]|nr:hypothetical protein [Clostridiales bacterium]
MSGSYGEEDFDVVANYVGNNENGNIDIFVGEDNNNIFDVVYCAIEREISKSILYFNSMRDEYTTVLKLYLRNKESGAFLIVELFNLPYLNITTSRADSDVDVNAALCWIERTFEPVNITETETTTRSANSSINKTATYTFNSFGYEVKDYVEYKLFWDFRDCSRGGSTTGNAGFELLRRYRTCKDYPNNNSSTYSSLFLYCPEFELYTGQNMA